MELSSKPTIDPRKSVMVFDLGGTWFRCAVVGPDFSVHFAEKVPAITFKNHPESTVRELQQKLVRWILQKYDSTSAGLNERIERVGISFGGPVNHHNGVILGSGPVWGTEDSSFDLTGALLAEGGEVDWVVVSDVTAAIVDHVRIETAGRMDGQFGLLTVSTGIAYRHWNNGVIDADPERGIQGEVGHVPIKFAMNGETLDFRCDCGGLNHLNAYCSGAGIENLRRHRQARVISEAQLDTGEFPSTEEDAVELTAEMLEAVTDPVAAVVSSAFLLTPSIEKLFLTGGVVEGLGANYLNHLRAGLKARNAYLGSGSGAADRLQIGDMGGFSCLRGAAFMARHSTRPQLRSNRASVWSVPVRKGASYLVHHETGLFDCNAARILLLNPDIPYANQRRLLFIDASLKESIGSKVVKLLSDTRVQLEVEYIEASEDNKTLDTLFDVLERIGRFNPDRKSEPPIVVGGGVLLDVVGLAASLHRRGVPIVRVPTTLIGAVDAGIGVKTAVNLNGYKNRTGTYFGDTTTFIDLSLLETLDRRNLANGMVKVLKIALVKDSGLFLELETHAMSVIEKRMVHPAAQGIVDQAIDLMLEELAPNLWEEKLERAVDYGHTLSPMIELDPALDLLHGESVAVDMAVFAAISVGRGLLEQSEFDRVVQLIHGLGLPVGIKGVDAKALWKALEDVTVHRGGFQRQPLISGLGQTVFVNDISERECESAVQMITKILLSDVGAHGVLEPSRG